MGMDPPEVVTILTYKVIGNSGIAIRHSELLGKRSVSLCLMEEYHEKPLSKTDLEELIEVFQEIQKKEEGLNDKEEEQVEISSRRK